MSNPTALVDHVYQMLINDRLELLRNEEYYLFFYYDNDLLKSLYTESQVQLPGHLLHNQHINYYDDYDHYDQNDYYENIPIYFSSKLYEFKNIVLVTDHRGQESEIPECTLIISPEPNVFEALKQKIFSICQGIMRNQAVNNLFVANVESTDLPQTFAFNISKHIQILNLKWCDFPSQTLSHLMQQINECSTLRKIDLQCTTLQSVSSLTLSNKTSLTDLNLSGMHMSQELSRSVCHQLTYLTQLKHLDLSDNDLSLVDMIHLSNKPNLSYLDCQETKMSTKLSKDVMGQLTYTTYLRKLDLSGNSLRGCLTSLVPDPNPGLYQLKELKLCDTALNKDDLHHLSNAMFSNKLPNVGILDLSHNTLSGCLSSLLPDLHPELPELEELYLSCTALNKDDLQHLTHSIQTHKLPGLNHLELFVNKLSEMETDVEHMVHTCVTHHQRELYLWLLGNGLSDAFKKKWEQRCAGTKIELEF